MSQCSQEHLLLTYDPSLVPQGGAAVYSQLVGIAFSYRKDPAGRAFHEKALRQSGLGVDRDDTNDAEQQDENDGSSMRTGDRKGSSVDFSTLDGTGTEADSNAGWRPGRRKKKKVKKNDGVDLYALLGLQHERWMASEAAIKAAYRRVALEHHPDKQRAMHGDDKEAMEAAENRFKAIQKAYETLSDPAKRREFDSLDAFDDSLPGEAEASSPENFYEAFGAAFRRYSKWSVNRPVPELGDDETDMDKVDSFYQFWFSFKSWREFPHPEEEDAESAESREERRWIERYNAKLREKPKKEEIRRIRGFVDLAYKLDPRITRRREAERAEKERRKAEREAEKARKEQEEKLREEQERKQKEEEEIALAEQKKKRQAERKALQKERSRLRKICGVKNSDENSAEAINIDVNQDDVELLCSQLSLVDLRNVCDTLSNDGCSLEDKRSLLKAKLDGVQQMNEQEAEKKEEAAKAAAEKAAKATKLEQAERIERLKGWSEEEIRMLRKGLEKFPPGTSRRWEAVQNYVRTRTVEEVLDMVKYGLKSGKFNHCNDNKAQISRKRQGNLEIKSDATQRIESFSDVEVNIQGEAAAVLAGSAVSAKVETTIPKTTEGINRSNGQSAWTQTEELTLVRALKEVPKEDKERWKKVSAAVGTKNDIECLRKFKEMKASYKAKKQGA